MTSLLCPGLTDPSPSIPETFDEQTTPGSASGNNDRLSTLWREVISVAGPFDESMAPSTSASGAAKAPRELRLLNEHYGTDEEHTDV
jgi:hypothetical protein